MLGCILSDRQHAEAVCMDIAGFALLQDGWDGECACKPSLPSINAARLYLMARPALACLCSPTLHANGNVMLEGEDGEWTIQFTTEGERIVAGEVPVVCFASEEDA